MLILLAQILLIITASGVILYTSSNISRGTDLKLFVLEAAEKAEDIKGMIDQERRFSTESAMFLAGASGGFLQPSDCGVYSLKEDLPHIPEDAAYVWKNVTTGCVDIPTVDNYLTAVRNYLNVYFRDADARLCNLLYLEDNKIPKQGCLNYESKLTDFDWDESVTIELNDWRPWEIEFSYFPDKPELSIRTFPGDKELMVYDYSTLSNLRMLADTLRMLRFAQDYVAGNYGENGDQSWINNQITEFIKTRYGTNIVALTVCDNTAGRGCYPYYDWMSSFLAYFIQEPPVCAKNAKEVQLTENDCTTSACADSEICLAGSCYEDKPDDDTWRYFSGLPDGKESGNCIVSKEKVDDLNQVSCLNEFPDHNWYLGNCVSLTIEDSASCPSDNHFWKPVEVELYDCFADSDANVDSATGEIVSSGSGITCAEFCYQTLTDAVEDELTVMLSDHTKHYTFPSLLREKTGYNWRGYVFEIEVNVECKEIEFRDPVTRQDCVTNQCDDFASITCVSYEWCTDSDNCEPILLDITTGKYRFKTDLSTLYIKAISGPGHTREMDPEPDSTSCDDISCLFEVSGLSTGENEFIVEITVTDSELLIQNLVVVDKQ